MEVITQRQGMGKSRIKFGETQLFFDFEVPTGYAYQSLTKNVIPKFIRSSAEKWLVPKDIRKLQIFKSKGVKLTKTNNLKLNTFLEKFEPSFKNTFLKKLNSLKYIEGNAKFTVLKLKADVKKFPSQLQNRVKLASKGKLSIKESNKLRTDLNNYINKNPGKLNIGSRTGSKILGEREAVAPVKTKLFKRSKKTSIDPETKIFINVIETSLKKSKIKVPKTFKARLKALTTDKFSRIKKNFSKGDLIKVKKFQKQLKLSDKLTSGQYLDLIEITKKMLLSKKGMVAKKIKRTSKGLRVRRTTPFVRRSSVKSKTTDVSASLTRSKAQSKTKPRTTTKEGKIKRRKVTARVSKPRTIKSIRTRTEPRVRSPLPRVITRPKPRPRSPKPRKGNRPRPKPRPPKPRPDPRPRDPVPRPRPRPPKPRPRTPLPRPRPRVRVPRRRVPVKIPIRFKVREKSKKWEKDVIEWISKQKKVYRPSLAAVLFNITSYKVPKSITGFEIRPILIKKPKISKRKK